MNTVNVIHAKMGHPICLLYLSQSSGLFFQNFSVEIQLESNAEFSHDHFKGQVDRAGGANYGKGFRDL